MKDIEQTISQGHSHYFAGKDGSCLGKRGQIFTGCCPNQPFILDIAAWRRASMRFLSKQTESKVKDKDLTPFFDEIKAIEFPLPPTYDDQVAIVNELERKLTEVEKLREAVEALPGAILREVFDFGEDIT